MGGKNKLPMKDLVVMFEQAGCSSVATYIQSGNVVFDATAAVAKTLASRVASDIEKRFGYKVPLVLRSGQQLASVIGANPYLPKGIPEKELHVMFLAATPGPDKIQGLDPARSAPDAFCVSGPEIYLHLPNGAGNSKLTNAWFDSKLSTISTGRNWATVLQLTEMTMR